MLTVLIEVACFLVACIFVALFTAFVRVVLTKWGIIEKLTVNLPPLFSKLVDCNFCSAFWLSTLVGIWLFPVLIGVSGAPWLYLFMGIFVAPISRLLA